MRRLLSSLFSFWVCITLCAAPSDHGRSLGESSSFSIFLGRILLIVLVIVALGVIFGFKKSKEADDSKINKSTRKFKDSTPAYPYHCAYCDGRGYNYGEEVCSAESGYKECTSCKGTGKVLSSKAIEILDKITEYHTTLPQRRERERVEYEKSKAECEKKRSELWHEICNAQREYTHIHKKTLTIEQHENESSRLIELRKEIQTQFRSEIDKCHPCRMCHGDNKECPHCFGFGKELSSEATKLIGQLKETNEHIREHSRILHLHYQYETTTPASPSASIGTFLLSSLTTQLQSELSNCPLCQSCNGKGKVFNFAVTLKKDISVTGGYRYYRRIDCPHCNGLGVYNPK